MRLQERRRALVVLALAAFAAAVTARAGGHPLASRLPAGHPGAGEPVWLFVDEITAE